MPLRLSGSGGRGLGLGAAAGRDQRTEPVQSRYSQSQLTLTVRSAGAAPRPHTAGRRAQVLTSRPQTAPLVLRQRGGVGEIFIHSHRHTHAPDGGLLLTLLCPGQRSAVLRDHRDELPREDLPDVTRGRGGVRAERQRSGVHLRVAAAN